MNETRNSQHGEPRTARQWLLDFGWKLDDPAEVDASELDRVMGHDEFWEWSSGKVAMTCIGNATWSQTERELLIASMIVAALLLVWAMVQ